MLLTILMVSLVFQAGQVGAPVAMVLKSNGLSELKIEGDKNPPLRVMQILRRSETIVSREGADTVIVFLEDGHRERLLPGFKVRLKRSGCDPQPAVKRIQSESTVESHVQRMRIHVLGNRGAAGVLRGGQDNSLHGLSPISESNILEHRPAFTWNGIENVSKYSVTLLESDGIQRIWTDTTTKNVLPFPAGSQSLTPGRLYNWKVTAELPGGVFNVIVNSRFLVSTKSEYDSIQRLQPFIESGDLADLVFAAVVLESYGVYDKAVEVLERIVESTPNEKTIMATLATYYRQAGRTAEAITLEAKIKSLDKTEKSSAESTDDLTPLIQQALGEMGAFRYDEAKRITNKIIPMARSMRDSDPAGTVTALTVAAAVNVTTGDTRNASPAYRLAVVDDFLPVAMGKLRNAVAGKQIVHLACHGIVDHHWNNFFGCLALTPGDVQHADPADDGYLTLAEVYELDLNCCDLTVLSACETNYGAEQSGEGMWSLTRAFIVAGATRVLGNNWSVDDAATAELVTKFFNRLGPLDRPTIDYPTALRDAKKDIRAQTKWQTP